MSPGRARPPSGPAGVNPRALEIVIRLRWIRQMAERHGIELAPGELRQTLRAGTTFGATTFGKDVTRSELLHVKLMEKLIADRRTLSTAAVKRYFEANRQRYSLPEQRDVYLVGFASEREAVTARAALAARSDWERQWKRGLRGIPGGSTVASTMLRGNVPPPLDRAIFSARVGALEGPIETESAWYVFELRNVTAAVPAAFAASRESVVEALRTRLSRQLDAEMEALLGPQTACREGVVAPQCPRTGET